MFSETETIAAPTSGATTTSGAVPATAGWLPVTESAVASIAEIPDVAVRNLWITQTYADLAQRLAAVIATDHTWCTFAVWASGTAGQSIREEELGGVLDDILDATGPHHTAAADANHAIRWLRRLGILRAIEATHVDDLLRNSVDVVSERIAHGNTLVFSELAPLFVRLLERFEAGRAPAGAEDSVLADIGLDPASDDLVVRAFRLYYQAAHEPYGRRRAQRVLAANIWAVLHEQQRLQPDIAASMDSGFIVIDDLVAPHVARWLPGFVTERVVRRVLDLIEAPIRDVFQNLATELMMKLYVPGAVLHLGETLPPLPNGEMFPAELTDVVLATLRDALHEWDGTDGTGEDCGAADWSDLHERMTYIVNLFRSRQHTERLSQAPFSEAQLDVMRELRLPDGPLLPR